MELSNTKMIMRLHIVERDTGAKHLMTAQVMVPDEWRENVPNLACTAVDYLMPEPLAVGERWGRMNEP